MLLETAEVAVVVGQSAASTERPRVRVLTAGDLQLVQPLERVLDGSEPGTTIRSVLEDYPVRVREQTGVMAVM